MARTLTFRERWRHAVSRADRDTFLWAVYAAPVGALLSVLLGLTGVFKVLGVSIFAAILVFGVQFVYLFVRASTALLSDVVRAAEREQDALRAALAGIEPANAEKRVFLAAWSARGKNLAAMAVGDAESLARWKDAIDAWRNELHGPGAPGFTVEEANVLQPAKFTITQIDLGWKRVHTSISNEVLGMCAAADRLLEHLRAAS
jgi:hypothetical protein